VPQEQSNQNQITQSEQELSTSGGFNSLTGKEADPAAAALLQFDTPLAIHTEFERLGWSPSEEIAHIVMLAQQNKDPKLKLGAIKYIRELRTQALQRAGYLVSASQTRVSEDGTVTRVDAQIIAKQLTSLAQQNANKTIDVEISNKPIEEKELPNDPEPETRSDLGSCQESQGDSGQAGSREPEAPETACPEANPDCPPEEPNEVTVTITGVTEVPAPKAEPGTPSASRHRSPKESLFQPGLAPGASYPENPDGVYDDGTGKADGDGGREALEPDHEPDSHPDRDTRPPVEGD
jgi:hypothetical protein